MTATDDYTIMRKIRLIRKHALELAKLSPSDDGIADACGLTREIEILLQNARRSWEQVAAVEMEPVYGHDQSRRISQREKQAPVATGQQYELVEKFKTTYTYNTPGILVGLAGENGSIVDALSLAVEVGAVRLAWQFQKLTVLLSDQDVDMLLVQREISDGEGPAGALIGKVRVKDGVRRVPVKEKS